MANPHSNDNGGEGDYSLFSTNSAAHGDSDNHVRSSLEIMGCVVPYTRFPPMPGVGPNLSRPPSGLPDFGFARVDNTPLQPEIPGPDFDAQATEHDGGNRSYVPSLIALAVVLISLLSTTAAGTAVGVLRQIGRPAEPSYTVWFIISLVVLVFSAAGLSYFLCDLSQILFRILRRGRAFSIRWPLFHLPLVRWPLVRWPLIRWPLIRWPFGRWSFRRRDNRDQSGGQPQSDLPHPEEFELGDLESQPPRPPTPYPELIRPIPIHPPNALPQGRPQALPLGFPVPPTHGVNRLNSMVSRMSNISFQSAPRSVSPLSDMPPTPPPKEPTVSRFQSREPLLPPMTSFGGSVAESDTRGSILTTLCDAVQLSNPDIEPGPATQNYTPLATASSPATARTSQSPVPIQSPRPTYPIELASPSRGREHQG